MKAVLFDLGRVLVHYDHLRTLSALGRVCQPGANIASLLREVLTPLQLGVMDAEGLYAHFAAKAGPLAPPEVFYEAFCAGLGRDARALAWVMALEQQPDVVVGVISNTNAVHVAWLDAHVPELRDLDLVMLSNEVGLQKPDPAAFRLALELLDVRAEDALFVDDLEEHVLAAQALALHGIVHRTWDETAPLIEEWLRG